MQTLTWMHCLVAGPRPVKSTCNTDDDAPLAALLLDRRLIKAKGPCLTSFLGGGVLAFLPDASSLFPDSTVLDAVPPDTLEAFTSLVRHALGPAQRRFKLLFRSTRDGATAAAFHSRCDAQGPTLTLIKDTAGNVFGGYTSLHWSSPAADDGEDGDGWVWRNDPAAFLFAIVNPHGDPPALFPSTANGRSYVGDSSAGPFFGYGDLYVTGAFDGDCCTYIGYSYVNTTRHSGNTVLTGAYKFTPAEVEVWGLADD
jgi:hypothetical protein